MKVLLVVSSLFPGGAERVSLDLADYLSRQGHEVHVFVARLSKKTPQVYPVPNKVMIHSAPFGVECSYTRPIVNAVLLRQCIKSIRPSAIVSLGSQYRLLSLMNVFQSNKVVLSERNYPPAFYSEEELRFVKAVYQKADKVVFQTAEVSDLFEKIDPKKKVIIPNAARFSSEVWKGKDSNRILFVGRLEKQKNPLMIVESFARFIRNNGGYILDICGDGSLVEQMKDCCSYNGITDRVHFHGHTKDINERMQNSLMYVSTSDYEGISNTMLEAMSIGMPVVCTDCLGGSANAYINTGDNGILIARNDSDACAKAMSEIASNRERAEAMGMSAKSTLQSVAPELIYEKWESEIMQVAYEGAGLNK